MSGLSSNYLFGYRIVIMPIYPRDSILTRIIRNNGITTEPVQSILGRRMGSSDTACLAERQPAGVIIADIIPIIIIALAPTYPPVGEDDEETIVRRS